MKTIKQILIIFFVSTCYCFAPFCTNDNIREKPVVNEKPKETGKPSDSEEIWVAASNSSAIDKAQANYICDGTNDQEKIQAAINKLPSTGGVINLHSGIFHCAGIITPKTGSTIKGKGESETILIFTNDGRINIDNENVTLDGFNFQGSNYSASVKWLGVINIRASHAKIENVEGTADATIQAVFLLIHDPSIYTPILEDIEFINCKAIDTGTYGFLHNAWGAENKTIKNVRYENCQAINCGRFGAFNPWVTGFNFAELNNIEGLRVKNCIAEGTLESGFHFEFDPTKRDCILENCISRNNGNKPYPAKPYDNNDMSTHYFGCGYYAPNADVTFINCTAEGNSMNGFYATNGSKLYNCLEKETGIGRTDFSYRVPAGYYSLPCRSVNPSLIMDNCESIDSQGYGIQIDLAKNVTIKNFQLINPSGYNGKGSSFGGTHNLFDNSEVNFYASGNRVETLIWVKNSINTIFSGKILSDGAKPFLVEGSRTSNILIKDMEIISNVLPVGPGGITIEKSAPIDQVNLQNVYVISPPSP